MYLRYVCMHAMTMCACAGMLCACLCVCLRVSRMHVCVSRWPISVTKHTAHGWSRPVPACPC
jgi:hypothetical protein